MSQFLRKFFGKRFQFSPASEQGDKMDLQKDNQSKVPETLNFLFNYNESGENGLYFNQIYLPEEVVILIFSHMPTNEILKLGLVCKRWYNILKMPTLWSTIYFRKFVKIPQPLPWYIFYALFETNYFNDNLLVNNCGQEKFNNWLILRNGGNQFVIEDNPVGCEPYPPGCLDLRGATCCFATSFQWCQKSQKISLQRNLIKYIINKHKPTIYVSEWVAGRFDCGGNYELKATLHTTPKEGSEKNDAIDQDVEISELQGDLAYEESELFDDRSYEFDLDEYYIDRANLIQKAEEFKYKAGEAVNWRKIEILWKDYPDDVDTILFEHAGCDNQFWQGHYGPKMAGGVVRLLFDSMKPIVNESIELESDEECN